MVNRINGADGSRRMRYLPPSAEGVRGKAEPEQPQGGIKDKVVKVVGGVGKTVLTGVGTGSGLAGGAVLGASTGAAIATGKGIIEGIAVGSALKGLSLAAIGSSALTGAIIGGAIFGVAGMIGGYYLAKLGTKLIAAVMKKI